VRVRKAGKMNKNKTQTFLNISFIVDIFFKIQNFESVWKIKVQIEREKNNTILEQLFGELK
jgi:hypothetical protein